MPSSAWRLPQPGSRPFPTGGEVEISKSSKILFVAAVLHGVAAPLTWIVTDLLVRDSVMPSELIPILYLIAGIGVVGQLAFAVTAGAGGYLVSKGGPNLAIVGTSLLVLGIVALVFSVAIAGGILGLIAGVLTAYAGNKVRKPAMPAWIPPTSWMPPQPPASPPSP